MFVNLHMNTPQQFLNNVFQTDETKVEKFGYHAQHMVSSQIPHTYC